MRRLPAKYASSAAIRLSESTTAPAKLFVHEGARESLVRKLKRAFNGVVVLTVVDNRKNLVLHEKKGGVLHVRLHHMFLSAPPSVLDNLVAYIVRDESALVVDQYIARNIAKLKKRSRGELHPQGSVYDLKAICNELNTDFFSGELRVSITWGRRSSPRTKPRKAIRLGGYDPHNKLIKLNPVLDKPWVPRYFVAYVVYHEMLHHIFPFKEDAPRRVLHSKAFNARESLFPRYGQALKWEEKNIRRLLRSR